MTFRIALSGLNAASADLATTANNIANSNTTGFKSSRAQFADFFTANSNGLTQNSIGSGTRLQRVAQQFNQGSLDITGNTLDMAISGEGFFTLSDKGASVYSRAGAFGTDSQGYVVNAAQQRLQVYPPNTGAAGFNTGRMDDLRLSTGDNPPAATSKIGVGINLPASAAVPATTPFNSGDATSYNNTTSVTVYDSLGASHSANLYFVKNATANDWTLHTQIDGADIGSGQSLSYSSSGALLVPADGQLTLPTYTPATGAAPVDLKLDLAGSTQYGDSFAVNDLSQDGYSTGHLAGLSVTDGGIVQARYTNGQARTLGQVALTTFANPQGLQQLGSASWAESASSGVPVHGEAGNTVFGQVQSGALEASNVDLTEQLVHMITAQRNFQANAQMISTADQITQTVINLR